MEPLVSVVIAAYNMANFVAQAVESVVQQTYPRIEVLIVDDGSTDGTAETVLPLLKDTKVTYIRQENQGQAAAKNRGVREARGDLVAFLDADDAWSADKLSSQVPLFAEKRVGIVYSRMVYMDEKGVELNEPEHEMFRGCVTSKLLMFNFVPFGTAVVRRECFTRMGGFDESLRMGIDYDLWLRYSTMYDFDYVARPLLRYRIWAGQMSRNCEGRYASGIKIMKKFIAAYPNDVDVTAQKDAWAYTYVGYGDCLYKSGRGVVAASKAYLTSLRHRPLYIPAWRALVLTVSGLRRRRLGWFRREATLGTR